MGWWEEEGEGGKEASGGVEGGRGRSYVLSDPPVRSRTPPSPPASAAVLHRGPAAAAAGVWGIIFLSDDGRPCANSKQSSVKHTIWFYCAAGTDGNLLQSKAVELWAARLIGLLFHFSPFLSVCLSATSIFKFSRSSTPPPSPKSTQPPLQPAVVTFDLCSRGVISRRNSFVFSSKKKPIWFQWPWRQCPRLCRFSIYYVSKWKRILLFCEIIQRGGNSTLLFLFVFICCVIK